MSTILADHRGEQGQLRSTRHTPSRRSWRGCVRSDAVVVLKLAEVLQRRRLARHRASRLACAIWHSRHCCRSSLVMATVAVNVGNAISADIGSWSPCAAQQADERSDARVRSSALRSNGADVANAALSVDGERLNGDALSRLVALDPGTHSFEAQLGNDTQRVDGVLRVGERLRRIELNLADSATGGSGGGARCRPKLTPMRCSPWAGRALVLAAPRW